MGKLFCANNWGAAKCWPFSPTCRRAGSEACAGAHYWARELAKLGHDTRLAVPQFVKPYVKGNKPVLS